jgi:HEAT repeat protein
MALGDRQDWHVRHDAAAALGEVGDPRAVEPLIACLRDPSEAVCDVAGWALGEIGDARAVEPLIAALRDSDGELRGNVAGALGRIGDPRAVEPLIAALADKDPLLRSAVATALGKLGDPRAVEPLVLALRDRGDDKGNGGAWVRQAAAQALMDMCRSGRLGPRDRALVVAQRSVITEEHHDRFGAYGDHEDEGIGVEFTL